MKGHIDVFTRQEVAGWAIADDVEVAELIVEVDGERLGAVRASEFRADLKRACGFRFAFPRPLENPKQARVYAAVGNGELLNSPIEFRRRLNPPSAADLAWTRGLELPPVDEMRLIGSDTAEIFVAQGSRTASVLFDHITEFFGEIHANHRILDFGCGVGRSLLPLSLRHPAQWFGCDVNDQAVAYLNRAAPAIQAFVNPFDPPLPVPAESFDCVISISIWTHLPIGRHLPWLSEIKRVLRPGGLALISTSGPFVVDVRRRRGDAGWDDLYAADLEEAGVLYRPYANSRLRGVTSSYGLTAHHPAHVQRLWSNVMPVVKTSIRALEAMQDLHMLTKL